MDLPACQKCGTDIHQKASPRLPDQKQTYTDANRMSHRCHKEEPIPHSLLLQHPLQPKTVLSGTAAFPIAQRNPSCVPHSNPVGMSQCCHPLWYMLSNLQSIPDNIAKYQHIRWLLHWHHELNTHHPIFHLYSWKHNADRSAYIQNRYLPNLYFSFYTSPVSA